ncbi:MAG: EAL domain-containing protein [Anaerovoracaceae bacterium]
MEKDTQKGNELEIGDNMKKSSAMKKIDMKRVLYASILLVCLIFIMGAGSAHGYVTAVKEPTGDADCVYVAGDPDGFPMEFYNERTGCYEGIMPDALKLVSQRTGLDFVYVWAGKEDQRSRLLKNDQVEMVTGYADVEFSHVAGKALKEKIRAGLDSITEEEWKELSKRYIYEGDRKAEDEWLILIKKWDGVFFAAVALVFIILLIRQKKKTFNAGMRDEGLGMGNDSFFRYSFERNIKEKLRPLYYIFYIGIDSDYVSEFYGTEDFRSVMMHTAHVISENLTKGDIAARVSDGGFGVAHRCNNDDGAISWIEKITDELSDFSGIVAADRKPDVYCGICKATVGKGDADSLLRTAQQCRIYAEKEERPYIYYNSDILKKHEERQLLIKNTVMSIRNGEFKVYLQPVVSTADGVIAGAEALTRWEHPIKGLLMPGRYIGLLTEMGTIGELDFYVFGQVCALLEKWRNTPLENMYLSCNFTRVTIATEDFAARIKETAAAYSFDHSRLVIEITEDTMLKYAETAIRNINELTEEGFRFSLDDFGSGYTSFSDLRNYPFSMIKIDKDILLGGATDAGSCLIKDLTAMCHDMGKGVVCEGVETEEQLKLVSTAGADYVQGFYFYRPLPAAECEKVMAGDIR